MSIDSETARVLTTLEEQVIQDYAPPRVKRDAHPKMHGCVLAEVTVGKDIHKDLQHGVFSEPGKRYKAWVRFSNAFRIQHDLEFETRGMAVKLLLEKGQPGKRLSEDEEKDTQDFLLATWPAFFLPDGTEYSEFARASGEDPPDTFRFFRDRGMLPAFYQLIRSSLVMARSPLDIRYFSQTPYNLGPHEVKLQARPLMTPELAATLPAAWMFLSQAVVANFVLQRNQTRAKSPAAEAWCDRYVRQRDFLRLGMMDFLARHEAAFELMVQRRGDPSRMPIDDATKVWPESLSRYERVATIRILRQRFWPQPGVSEELAEALKRMMNLGENMSFHPWHALEAHKPLGAINEMRRKIYPAIVKLRHRLNKVEGTEPAEAYDRLEPVVTL